MLERQAIRPSHVGPQRQGHPDVGSIANRRSAKITRRDADDAKLFTVDQDGALQDVDRPAEPSLPQPVADRRHAIGAAPDVVRGSKQATENRRHAERREEGAGDGLAAESLRVPPLPRLMGEV